MNHELKISDLESDNFKRFQLYWDSIRTGRMAPSWKDVDLLAIGTDIIPFITVTDVKNEPRDHVYRFWGTGHLNAKGCDNTGKSILVHEPQSMTDLIWLEYELVVRERRPAAFRRDILIRDGIALKSQDVLRLPLSNDGETVSQIISYADWRSSTETR